MGLAVRELKPTKDKTMSIDPFITKLLDANVRVYLACTGAGAGIQNALWNVPGCSAFLVGASFPAPFFVGAEFPYDPSATERFLGFRPEKFCSAETAIDLALESYSRACIKDGHVTTSSPIGLGLTASVASLREHRGDHRIHAAVVTRQGAWAVNGVLEKGVGLDARIADGAVADGIGLALILRAAGISDVCEVYGVQLEFEDVSAQARRQFLARGLHTADGKRLATTPKAVGNRHLFPGAFNPPHEGHLGIASSVARTHGAPIVFAITANAPHKPPVTLTEMIERAALLLGYDRMFTEDDPLYLDKARRYSGCTIVLGADALQRLLDPKWGPAIAAMLSEFKQLGTTFLVFSRVTGGEWVTLIDVLKSLDTDSGMLLSAMSRTISGRWDISSSELRAKAEAGAVKFVAALDTAQTVPWDKIPRIGLLDCLWCQGAAPDSAHSPLGNAHYQDHFACDAVVRGHNKRGRSR